MPEYRLTWAIEIDAPSPEAAAEIAESCMLDPTRLGNIFEVEDVDGDGEIALVVVNDGVGRLRFPDG